MFLPSYHVVISKVRMFLRLPSVMDVRRLQSAGHHIQTKHPARNKEHFLFMHLFKSEETFSDSRIHWLKLALNQLWEKNGVIMYWLT